MCSPPVDLSFKNISRITGAVAEVPRCGVRPLTTDSIGRFLSRSLRLSNNRISDITDLHYVLHHLMADPSQLGWLDLSFNHITYIDPVLRELRELRVLYLHGNNIMEMSTVDKLGELPHLHTITLHGNAIENTRGYRWRHLHPCTESCDFCPATFEEHGLQCCDT
ncbi:leucine-rich repeat-containing protein 51-like isoform X2 [Betta splendens]|uniref:Leucine-rich repeat-containing protein 51 n=1 Tax=Betta splendens TaxID=158456 RepID=A0A6P7LAQ5_BETSP|nr:leucine-rich repeat-containing protein 51-like isoform X2 [Betta splendens]